MANGTSVGAHGSTRRNRLPRVNSAEGVQARFDIRKAHVPNSNDKFRDGFTVPGSRNPRKVGRG